MDWKLCTPAAAAIFRAGAIRRGATVKYSYVVTKQDADTGEEQKVGPEMLVRGTGLGMYFYYTDGQVMYCAANDYITKGDAFGDVDEAEITSMIVKAPAMPTPWLDSLPEFVVGNAVAPEWAEVTADPDVDGRISYRMQFNVSVAMDIRFRCESAKAKSDTIRLWTTDKAEVQQAGTVNTYVYNSYNEAQYENLQPGKYMILLLFYSSNTDSPAFTFGTTEVI